MKKALIIMSTLILVLVMSKEYKKIIIPQDSIRIRIIANSNNIEDQIIKLKVKEKIEKELYPNMKDIKNIENARKEIENSIPKIETIISNTIKSNNFSINYGKNYFPEKELYGIYYDKGNYESLTIKLGASKGNNWWCVLFPPLCTIDVKDNDTEYIEYKSKVLEILTEYN